MELLQPTNPISHEVDWERFPLLIHSSAPPPFPQQQTWGIGGTLKDVYIKLAMNGGAGKGSGTACVGDGNLRLGDEDRAVNFDCVPSIFPIGICSMND